MLFSLLLFNAISLRKLKKKQKTNVLLFLFYMKIITYMPISFFHRPLPHLFNLCYQTLLNSRV